VIGPKPCLHSSDLAWRNVSQVTGCSYTTWIHYRLTPQMLVSVTQSQHDFVQSHCARPRHSRSCIQRSAIVQDRNHVGTRMATTTSTTRYNFMLSPVAALASSTSLSHSQGWYERGTMHIAMWFKCLSASSGHAAGASNTSTSPETSAFMVTDYCSIHGLRTRVQVTACQISCVQHVRSFILYTPLTQSKERVPRNAHLPAAIQACRSKESL